MTGAGTPQHGLSSNKMAPITSDYGTMCSPAHQMALITSGFVPSRTREYELWITMFEVEHLVLLLRVLVLVISPASPAWIEKAREVISFRRHHRYKTAEELERERRYMEEYNNKMQNGYRQLQSILLHHSLEDVTDLFCKVDKDHSGAIDDDELHMLFIQVGVEFSKSEVAQALIAIGETTNYLLTLSLHPHWNT